MGRVCHCWVCEGRGERQVPLDPERPVGGRTICRACLRRLIAWLARAEASPAAADVWGPPPAEAAADAQEAATRAIFWDHVREGLLDASAHLRCAAALACLEMGMRSEALRALGSMDPASVDSEELTDTLLKSLMTRLLDPDGLAIGGHDALRLALKP